MVQLLLGLFKGPRNYNSKGYHTWRDVTVYRCRTLGFIYKRFARVSFLQGRSDPGLTLSRPDDVQEVDKILGQRFRLLGCCKVATCTREE